MDYDLYSRLQYEMKMLKYAQDEYSSYEFLLKSDYQFFDSDLRSDSDRASRFDPQRIQLKRNVKKSGIYYYGKYAGDKKFKYIGKESNSLVTRVKESVHASKALEAISTDIDLIESLLDGFRPYDSASVNAMLPLTYQSRAVPAASGVISSAYSEAGRKWKAEKLAFQAGFPENYPEHKTEQTSDGTWVKTLSEVVLYERFLSAGLIFIYELPLASKDYGPNLYPDFTILSPIDCKTEIVVEYIGRLDLPKYREDFAKRIYRYMQNGYIPGVNLFFAYGDERGHVDSLQINKIIADILGVR
jgi:hypothetical protein